MGSTCSRTWLSQIEAPRAALVFPLLDTYCEWPSVDLASVQQQSSTSQSNKVNYRFYFSLYRHYRHQRPANSLMRLVIAMATATCSILPSITHGCSKCQIFPSNKERYLTVISPSAMIHFRLRPLGGWWWTWQVPDERRRLVVFPH